MNDNKLEWIIQRSNDQGLSWYQSYLDMGRPPEYILPDQLFRYIVDLIGEHRRLFDPDDLSAYYRIFKPQTNTVYCVYTVQYLLDCSVLFNLQNKPFEILT
jgi:hypothetical protein